MRKKKQRDFLYSERAQVLLKVLLVLFMLLAVLIGVYFIYMNLPGEPQILNSIVNNGGSLEVINLSSVVPQFYSNMKFNHNQISYKIDFACSQEKRNRMIEAFSDLSEKVGIISFVSLENPDIEVSCTEDEKHSLDEDYFIAGEGGAREIIQTGKYNVITEGIILLYGNSEAVKCDWANIELHELLHVFGFDHSTDKNSLMYPYLKSCDQKLDQSIIDDLKKLYSQENLADLYFEKVSATKKGRYLDFNVTVKNSGVIDAKSVSLIVLDEGEEVEDFSLNDIDFGAGVTFYVSNLKLNNRNSEDVRLVIDSNNLIKEIDENNNLAKLSFM